MTSFALPENADSSTATYGLVSFLHPGYDDSFNKLCVLPAADLGGVHFGTALTVCGIIANNAFDGWFAKEKNAPREEGEWDSVLRGRHFYFFTSDNRNDKYPVVISFEQWRYPDTLPPKWESLEIPRGIEQRQCCLSAYAYSLESAHLVPHYESSWYTANIFDYTDAGNDEPHNKIYLRGDLHTAFNNRHWCMVVKDGRLVCQTFRPFNRSLLNSFVEEYHNKTLLPLHNKSKECLFARLAWTVLPLVGYFVINRELPTTVIIKNGEATEVSGQELRMSFKTSKASKRGSTDVNTTSASRSNALSKRKRTRDDEKISISISDWLNQVPSPQNQHPGGYPPVTIGDYLHD
ncbi:hypothetical protein Egran_05420, partial [Elaphomyces granulatus]